MFYNIKRIISNPVVNLLLAIFIGFIFYKLSTQSVELSYSVSNAEEMFSNELNGDQAKLINSKGELVKDIVYLKRVVLWNSGDKYIEKTDFFDKNPLRVVVDDSVKLVSSKIINKSRETLDFSARESSDNTVLITLGDDVIEAKDGITLSLFYTGNKLPEVKLKGRIRGIGSEKFNEVNWSYLTAINELGTIPSILFVGVLLSAALLLIVNISGVIERDSKTIYFFYGVLGVAVSSILIIVCTLLIYMMAVGYFYNVVWL